MSKSVDCRQAEYGRCESDSNELHRLNPQKNLQLLVNHPLDQKSIAFQLTGLIFNTIVNTCSVCRCCDGCFRYCMENCNGPRIAPASRATARRRFPAIGDKSDSSRSQMHGRLGLLVDEDGKVERTVTAVREDTRKRYR
jgi:hypothetical protein